MPGRRRDLNIENAHLAAQNAALTAENGRLKRRVSILEATVQRREQERDGLARRLKAALDELATLRSQVKHFAQLLYGRKSEQGPLPGGGGCEQGTPAQPGREAGAAPDDAAPAPRGKRGQVPGKPGHGRRVGRGLPTVEHHLTEDVRCTQCGTPYVPLAGAFAVSTVVDWVTRVVAHHYLRQKYRQGCACPGHHAHADETGYTVLDAAQHRRRWWLWVVAAELAVAFLLDPHRSAAVLRTFYAWTGETPPPSPLLTLLTDALPTYTCLVGWTRQALCWAHQRRRFRDVGRAHPALAPWAEQWRLRIVRLYQLHRARRRAEPGTPAWLQADAALRAHAAHLRAVLDQELAQSDLHPDQRKALVHLQQRWTGYTAFLDDPLVPLDNNLAERLLRRAVLLRKNAFFIGADWAATFAAVLWSVLATAERNGLNTLTYLCAYFQACAEHGGLPLQGAALARFLPWALSPQDKAA